MAGTAASWGLTAATFGTGLFAGMLFMWLWFRAESRRDAEDMRSRMAVLEAERERLSASVHTLEAEYESVREEKSELRIRLARMEEARSADAEKLDWLENARAGMRDTFQALAGQTLQASAETLVRRSGESAETLLDRMQGGWQTHRAELHNLIDPVREHLDTLETHIRDLEQKRQGAYQGMETRLRELSGTQAELQRVTVTLAQALKSPTIRGKWGEIQLRRVVELAGMTPHTAFTEQAGTGTGRPDMIIHLPGGGVLPVDAKVPLTAWLEAVEATDDAVRRDKLARHVQAVQARIRELGRKAYWEQFPEAPDFVVLFVPNEICLSAAFEQSPDLFEYAISQRVLVATPMTLIALLRSAVWGWQQYRMTENARRIVDHSRELHKRLERFTVHLADIGKHLNNSVSGYNRAVGSLERRLLPLTRKFHEMGVTGDEPVVPDPVEIRAQMPQQVSEEASD